MTFEEKIKKMWEEKAQNKQEEKQQTKIEPEPQPEPEQQKKNTYKGYIKHVQTRRLKLLNETEKKKEALLTLYQIEALQKRLTRIIEHLKIKEGETNSEEKGDSS